MTYPMKLLWENLNDKKQFQNHLALCVVQRKSEKLFHAIMICKDNQPLNIVEDEGFQYLMKTVSPNFKVPSRRYISSKIFEKLLWPN